MAVSLKSIAGKLFSNGKEVALKEDVPSIDPNYGIVSGGDDTSGHWTKFPDGTMVAYHHGPLMPMNQNVVRSDVWTVPENPIDGSISVAVRKDSNSFDTEIAFEKPLNLFDSIIVYAKNPTASGGNCIAYYTFIGRWK